MVNLAVWVLPWGVAYRDSARNSFAELVATPEERPGWWNGWSRGRRCGNSWWSRFSGRGSGWRWLYAGQQRSEVAENLVIVLPVLSVIVALYAGVWPYVVIAQLVRRRLDLILHPVRAQMRHPDARLLLGPGFDEVVKFIQRYLSEE